MAYESNMKYFSELREDLWNEKPQFRFSSPPSITNQVVVPPVLGFNHCSQQVR